MINYDSCLVDYIYPRGCKSYGPVDPKVYPYQVNSSDFKTLKDAEDYAKRQASEGHVDVVIKQRISVVKFPIPDLKVESLVVS